jgi:hypothetical protein
LNRRRPSERCSAPFLQAAAAHRSLARAAMPGTMALAHRPSVIGSSPSNRTDPRGCSGVTVRRIPGVVRGVIPALVLPVPPVPLIASTVIVIPVIVVVAPFVVGVAISAVIVMPCVAVIPPVPVVAARLIVVPTVVIVAALMIPIPPWVVDVVRGRSVTLWVGVRMRWRLR